MKLQRKILPLLLAASLLPVVAYAADSTAAPEAKSEAHAAPVPKQREVVTHGSVRIGNQDIRYTATAGTILLRNDKNEPVASMFYVAYTKDGVRDPAKRPITFLYNGGPGSSSIWLHLGGLGPMKVALNNAGATPPAPYAIVPNHDSLLDASDLVFIDAVGTGYSRVVGKGTDKMFWGVDQDVKSFGQFIQRYLTQFNRWNSPKFLLGESYGTTRSAALSEYLQDQGISVNGVVLQSSILNYGLLMPGSDAKYELYLPTYTALAWYHHKLPGNPGNDLPALLAKVQSFALGPYAQALAQGDNLPAAQRDAIAEQLHQYTGLPVAYIKRANLRVEASNFRKELMLPERESIGRYDGRYAGLDINAIGSTPDFDPSDQFVSPGFTTAFNWYVTNMLKYHSQRPYKVMNDKTIGEWDWHHAVPGSGWKLPLPYVAGDLGAALRKNPYLRVLSANGYFDLATPYFATEYDLDHMMLEPKLRSHVEFAFYDSGHMIYLNPQALSAYHADLDRFYRRTLAVDAAGEKQ